MAGALLGGLGQTVGRDSVRARLRLLRPALPRALLPLSGARGRCCSLLQRRQPSGGSRTLQLLTKLPCSPCDVTVVQQRSKPGGEWEGAGSGGGGAGAERRGAARGRAPRWSGPRSPVFIEMQIAPRQPFSPRWKKGAGGAVLLEWVPGIWGWGGGACRGGQLGGRAATRSWGETIWRGGTLRTWRHPIFEPGEWARFRERHEGTHGRRGGQGISASTSSFIFINTCKFQEPFNLQRHGTEPRTPLEASFRRPGGSLQTPSGVTLNV